jgi:hypothetical protein
LSTVLALWRRFPVVVRAVLTGLVVATAGTTPWAVLVSANTKHLSVVPWAVPPTALYLWLFWRYVRGAGWPRSTVYGTLAYLTKSILPSLVLHAGGNVLSAFDLSARGRSEWQASRNPKQLIWVTGPDGSFWRRNPHRGRRRGVGVRRARECRPKRACSGTA